MSRRPLLLIELLDALGGHEPDAALHASALRPLVGPVRPVAVAWSHERATGPDDRSAARTQVGGASIAAVTAAVRAHQPERVVVAGGCEAASAAIAALPAGVDVRWWPTAIENGASATRPAPVLLHASAAGADEHDAMAHAVIDAAPGRERVPLWDGDFVLAAAPLAGAGGRAVIEAFASVAEDRAGLDLVVLADPQPTFEALARELGVGPRVHFAGPSPRGAEPTWLSSAAAVLLAARQPISAGWVLRVLAAGVPLLPVGNGAARAAAWLDAHEAHSAPKRVRHDVAASLAAVLDRGLAVDRAVQAGRELAARHRLGTWSARLAGPWAEPGRDAREVA